MTWTEPRGPARSWSNTAQVYGISSTQLMSVTSALVVGLLQMGWEGGRKHLFLHTGREHSPYVSSDHLQAFNCGTFPLLAFKETYTPRQLRKSQKWVRNKELQVKQLLLSFLAARQLRHCPECCNYSKVKAVPVSFREFQPAPVLCTAIDRRSKTAPGISLVFMTMITTWNLTVAIPPQTWTCKAVIL